MVLVDTSIWIAHFREGSPHLQKILSEESVLCHPFVIGELACGNIKNRKEIIALLGALPKAMITQNDEILYFIEQNHLYGLGIGLIDVHLLASVLLSNAQLWTADKKLQESAARLKCQYVEQ